MGLRLELELLLTGGLIPLDFLVHPQARRALFASVVLIVGMIAYVLGFTVQHRAWMHRRAAASQTDYLRHGADPTFTQVEFQLREQAASLSTNVLTKVEGPMYLEYYDGARPAERRLLARVVAIPAGEEECQAQAEIFYSPRLKATGAPAHPGGDSVWRKAYYLARARDSIWQKMSLWDFPDRKDALASQVERDSL